MKTYYPKATAVLLAVLATVALAPGQTVPAGRDPSRVLREREIGALRGALDRAQNDPTAKLPSGAYRTDLKISEEFFKINEEFLKNSGAAGKDVKVVVGDLKVNKPAKQITITPETGRPVTLNIEEDLAAYIGMLGKIQADQAAVAGSQKETAEQMFFNTLEKFSKTGESGAAFFVNDGDRASLFRLSSVRDIASEVPDPGPGTAPVIVNPRPPPANPPQPPKDPEKKDQPPPLQGTEKAPTRNEP